MILAAALALTIGGAGQADAWTLFGQSVALPALTAPTVVYPEEVLKWPGWGSLSGAPTPAPFKVDGPWTEALNPPALASGAAIWKVKVVLIPVVSSITRNAAGNLTDTRYVVSPPERTLLSQGLALAAAAVQAQSGGRVGVSFTTDEDASLYPAGENEASIEDYLAPRLNGGSFEANDKLYRGPFQLCLVVRADWFNPKETIINATPVAEVGVATLGATPGEIALNVLHEFQFAGKEVASRHGRAVTGSLTPGAAASLFGDVPVTEWAALSSLGPIPGAEWQAGAAIAPYSLTGWNVSAIAPSLQSANAHVSASGDTLNLKLSGEFSHGGMSLPTLPSTASAGQFLTLRMRSLTPDAVAIGPLTDGHLSPSAVALGARSTAGPSVPVPADGKWHTVAIPVSNLIPKGSEAGLAIGVLPQETRHPKISMLESSYDFADFKVVDQVPDGALTLQTPPDLDARLTELHLAAKKPETALDALTQALADPDDSVKLNACDALTSTKVPGIEQKIAAVAGNFNPALTDLALKALAFQDSTVAHSLLAGFVQTGPGTHAKAKAAFYLSQLKEGGSVSAISGLEGTARDWRDRLDALRAVAQRGGPEANLFLRSFLEDSDPQVRLEAILALPMDDADGMKRVLFFSVNDPFDVVRATACEKLLQSNDPDVKKEGYRGASDDSWFVRQVLIDWLARHPSSGDRVALRQAILSPYGAVRAATLKALASSPDPVVVDEIANVLNDQDPQVQLALLELDKAKKLALSAESLALLKQSHSPAVVAATAELP